MPVAVLRLLLPLALALAPLAVLPLELPLALAPVPMAELLLLPVPLALALVPQAKLETLPPAVAPPPACGSAPFVLPPQTNWPWAGTVVMMMMTMKLRIAAIENNPACGKRDWSFLTTACLGAACLGTASMGTAFLGVGSSRSFL